MDMTAKEKVLLSVRMNVHKIRYVDVIGRPRNTKTARIPKSHFQVF